MEPQSNSSPAVPIAIIFGFALIAVAIFFTNNSQETILTTNQNEGNRTVTEGVPRVVSENDYIRGNPNAPILMVEYSDYDCPFCKQYHHTMKQIMDEYGVTGKVAWVYRQLPLAPLHPNSPRISEAALCVGDIGGNSAFWKFTDTVFDERDTEEQTNITKLPQFAEMAGVNINEFNKCLRDGKMKNEVEASLTDGFNAGAQGTPYTVLMVGNQQAVINGAQPYDVVKGIIQNLIDQLDGKFDVEGFNSSEIQQTSTNTPEQ